MESEQAGTWRARWRWWMAVPIVIAAFAVGYGITKLVQSGGSSEPEPTPIRGITFTQGHTTPLGISERQFEQRIPIPPTRVQHKHTHPPQTCRYYPVTDQVNTQFVFCFAHGKLVLAYGGPTR